MDKLKFANNLSRIESLLPKAPTNVNNNSLQKQGDKVDSGSFKETFDNLINEINQSDAKSNFNNLDLANDKTNSKSLLKFSNHAIERMQSRGINYTSERLQKLDEAVKKAAAKGSKDTLVLMDDSAVIVSVKNNTIVTVMDKNNLKENVFTNIDSTVVI